MFGLGQSTTASGHLYLIPSNWVGVKVKWWFMSKADVCHREIHGLGIWRPGLEFMFKAF